MKKCAFVYNPESGKTNSKKNLEKIEELFNANMYEVDLIPTQYKRHAIKLVENLSDEYDLLVSCGGDGTLNEVIRGNLKRESKILMAHLPSGTVNDVGFMYGYTTNQVTNLQMLLNGTVKNIDVCMINNRPFVYVACIGNYVDVAYNTPRRVKKKFGRLAYMMSALREFKSGLKFYDLEYKIDNKSYNGTYSFVFISNTSRIGGFNNIYKDVKLDDNMYEVVFCNIKTKPELMLALTNMLTTNVKDIKGFTYYRTNNLEINFKKMPKESWCVDGEEMKHMNKTFIFSVNKDINMMLPKKNIVKLFKEIEEVENEFK